MIVIMSALNTSHVYGLDQLAMRKNRKRDDGGHCVNLRLRAYWVTNKVLNEI